MKKVTLLLTALLFFSINTMAQGFDSAAEGEKKFEFKDDEERNQASFFSTTPLEDIEGTAEEVSGYASFDAKNLAGTLKGKVAFRVATMKTGIKLRDEHLRSDTWLNAEEYPEIVFEITGVKDLEVVADNKLKGKVEGRFTLHGVTKNVSADTELTYLAESEQTKEIAPGDLLGVNAKFTVRLSEYEVSNKVIGEKVAEIIDVTVNLVGYSAN